MPVSARRPFLQLCLTGVVAFGIPTGGQAARKPPPRADSPLVGVDPVFVLSGLTARWQAAMRQDLGWAARWSEMDSGDVLAQLEQGQIHAGLYLTHPRADALAHQGLIHARHRIAKTDVLLLGPNQDLAGIRGEQDIGRALAQVSAAISAGAARWQAPAAGSALAALSAQLEPGLARQTQLAPVRPDLAKEPPYRLMTRAQWLRQPPQRERLKIWSAPDPRLVLHAEVACAYRARHEGAKLLVNWLQWPLAQSPIKAAYPAWQRVKQD